VRWPGEAIRVAVLCTAALWTGMLALMALARLLASA